MKHTTTPKYHCIRHSSMTSYVHMSKKLSKKRRWWVSSLLAYCGFLLLIIPFTSLYDSIFHSRSLNVYIVPLGLSLLFANVIVWRPLRSGNIKTFGLLWSMFALTAILVVKTNMILIFFPYIIAKGINYDLAMVRCLHQPVIGTDFLGYRYTLPGDSPYSSDFLDHLFDSKYFCTEKEAKQAGYKKDFKLW